ncbi:cytochrome c oxidase subunit 5b-1, mitochondrial-like [Tasmannia lanceolata]|uniref:cytochrome c oxidase subunit 5b-1, mitochondrial-like n=1 Tax=Tasmannia lanceolata TaxID=3420 RepID=UPI004063B9F6
MWRRVSAQLQTLAQWRSISSMKLGRSDGGESLKNRFIPSASSYLHSSSPAPFKKTPPLFSSDEENIMSKGKKRVEDVMPIATGHEREEIEAELEGRKRFDMDAPVGPFGTKEAPAIVQSHYDKRIVGCPGGEGEDEHDVVWFWLEKGKPHECPVCSQYFELEVIGEGGPPDGHGDDDH